MNKAKLLRQAKHLEEQAKIICGHGKSKLWCVLCRRNHVEATNEDRFIEHHSFKKASKLIKRQGSVSPKEIGKYKGALYQ